MHHFTLYHVITKTYTLHNRTMSTEFGDNVLWNNCSDFWTWDNVLWNNCSDFWTWDNVLWNICSDFWTRDNVLGNICSDFLTLDESFKSFLHCFTLFVSQTHSGNFLSRASSNPNTPVNFSQNTNQIWKSMCDGIRITKTWHASSFHISFVLIGGWKYV